MKRVNEFLASDTPKGVIDFWPVNGDIGRCVFDLVNNVLVFHGLECLRVVVDGAWRGSPARARAFVGSAAII